MKGGYIGAIMVEVILAPVQVEVIWAPLMVDIILLHQKYFKRSNALMVRAEPFTQVPGYGPVNGHLGIHEEGVVKIGFTPHR